MNEYTSLLPPSSCERIDRIHQRFWRSFPFSGPAAPQPMVYQTPLTKNREVQVDFEAIQAFMEDNCNLPPVLLNSMAIEFFEADDTRHLPFGELASDGSLFDDPVMRTESATVHFPYITLRAVAASDGQLDLPRINHCLRHELGHLVQPERLSFYYRRPRLMALAKKAVAAFELAPRLGTAAGVAVTGIGGQEIHSAIVNSIEAHAEYGVAFGDMARWQMERIGIESGITAITALALIALSGWLARKTAPSLLNPDKVQRLLWDLDPEEKRVESFAKRHVNFNPVSAAHNAA